MYIPSQVGMARKCKCCFVYFSWNCFFCIESIKMSTNVNRLILFSSFFHSFDLLPWISLSCQLCKNNLFNTIKSLSFILAGCSLKTVKCKSQFFTVENEEGVERTFLMCSPNCYCVLKQVNIFHSLHRSCAHQQLWHIFTWPYFNQCFYPVCVGCLYPQCRAFALRFLLLDGLNWIIRVSLHIPTFKKKNKKK